MYTSMNYKNAATAPLLVMHQFVQSPDDRDIQEWTGCMRESCLFGSCKDDSPSVPSLGYCSHAAC